MPLRERRDPIGVGRVVDSAVAVLERAAPVAVPYRADGNHLRVDRRVAHPLLAVEAVVLVARRGHHQDVLRQEVRQLVAQAVGLSDPRAAAPAVGRVVPVPVVAVAERQIDGHDVVGVDVGRHPLKRLLGAGEVARPAVTEDLQVDDVHARRHAGVQGVLGGHNAADVRAVAALVGGLGIAVGEVVMVDDPVGHAVPVAVRAEERMIQVHARVDDHRRHPRPVDVGEAGILAEAIQLDQVQGRPRVARRIARPGLLADVHGGQHQLGTEDVRSLRAVRVRLGPAVRHLQHHAVCARAQVGEGVVAVPVRGGPGLAVLPIAVVVEVQEHGPAAQALLAGALVLVGIGVVEDRAADLAQPEEARVPLGVDAGRDAEDGRLARLDVGVAVAGVVAAGVLRAEPVARRHDELHLVRAVGVEAVEAVAAVGGRDVRVQQAAAAVVEVHGVRRLDRVFQRHGAFARKRLGNAQVHRQAGRHAQALGAQARDRDVAEVLDHQLTRQGRVRREVHRQAAPLWPHAHQGERVLDDVLRHVGMVRRDLVVARLVRQRVERCGILAVAVREGHHAPHRPADQDANAHELERRRLPRVRLVGGARQKHRRARQADVVPAGRREDLRFHRRPVRRLNVHRVRAGYVVVLPAFLDHRVGVGHNEDVHVPHVLRQADKCRAAVALAHVQRVGRPVLKELPRQRVAP